MAAVLPTSTWTCFEKACSEKTAEQFWHLRQTGLAVRRTVFILGKKFLALAVQSTLSLVFKLYIAFTISRFHPFSKVHSHRKNAV